MMTTGDIPGVGQKATAATADITVRSFSSCCAVFTPAFTFALGKLTPFTYLLHVSFLRRVLRYGFERAPWPFARIAIEATCQRCPILCSPVVADTFSSFLLAHEFIRTSSLLWYASLFVLVVWVQEGTSRTV